MLKLSNLTPDTIYMVLHHDNDSMPGKMVKRCFSGLTNENPTFVAGIAGERSIHDPNYIQIYPASIPYELELMQRSALRERRVVHSVLMNYTPLPHDLQREILSYLFPVKQYQEKNGISRVILDTKRDM
jgi:hypothetical protein